MKLYCLLIALIPAVASADAIKCIDPKSGKSYFTDGICPSSTSLQKSVATDALRNGNSIAASGGMDVQALREQEARLRKELELAVIERDYARRNYTDKNAISAAEARVAYAKSAAVSRRVV